jgi:hypothetical protein
MVYPLRFLLVLLSGALVAAVPVDPLNPWGRNPLDPVISTLNTGNVLDVQPYVSADGKYITFGRLSGQQSDLKDMFVENIEALAKMGYVRAWRPTFLTMLPGEWSGKIDSISSSTGKPFALNIGGKDLGTFRGNQLENCKVSNFSFIPDGRVVFNLTWTEVGKNPRKTVLGKVVGATVERVVTISAIMGPEGNSLVGMYAGPEATDRGPIELRRKAPELPSSMQASWIADARDCNPVWRSSSNKANLSVTFGAGSTTGIMPQMRTMKIHPLALDEKSGQFVCTVEIQRLEDKTLTRGILNGVLEPDGQKIRASIDCGFRMRGQLRFTRDPNPPAEPQTPVGPNPRPLGVGPMVMPR